MVQEALLELTSGIITAHVSNNAVSAEDLPRLIQNVFTSLSTLGQPETPIEEVRQPAVSLRSSVRPDAIACLECGARLKTLKRHLMTEHDLTPDDYRARWNLGSSYPLTAADYSEKRKTMAVNAGLGKSGGRKSDRTRAETAPAIDAQAPTEEAKAPGTVRRKLGIKAG